VDCFLCVSDHRNQSGVAAIACGGQAVEGLRLSPGRPRPHSRKAVWCEAEAAIRAGNEERSPEASRMDPRTCHKSMLGQLLDLVKNDVVMRLDQVIDLATKVWISHCQISNFPTKWGTELPHPDISHTWFQRPCRLEDPLGRYHPIASEYSYTQMLAVVLDKFQSGPGSRRMQSGEYEIVNSRDCAQFINQDTFTGFTPGMSLRMAVLLHELQTPADGCPIPSCGSRTYSDCVGGGKTWLAYIGTHLLFLS
jgi:hypothetical protein